MVQASSAASLPHLGSAVFAWDQMVVRPTGVGARREVNDSPTATLNRFECHVTTLKAGRASHPPHQHAGEELIILKEGTLDVHLNGHEHRIGPGSLAFFAANDWHAVTNVGRGDATYFVFNFASDLTPTAPKEPAARSAAPDRLASGVYEWTQIAVIPTSEGARREFFHSPTVTFRGLSTHATTLRAGETSHAPHRHPDEEIIVVQEGQIEATINGQSTRGGPGSIFFFASNDEHGLRNLGDSFATYYVLRIVTEKTVAFATE